MAALITIEPPTMTISDEERAVSASFGLRVTQLRKARNMSRPTRSAAGACRCPPLRLLARTLGVSLDELLAEGDHAPTQARAGLAASAAPGAHQPVPQAQATHALRDDRRRAFPAGALTSPALLMQQGPRRGPCWVFVHEQLLAHVNAVRARRPDHFHIRPKVAHR